MPNASDAFAFCQNELKQLDPVSHFAALTAPQDNRAALMVLYAFVVNLQRIPMLVSTPEMGQIRLQWWRDIIADANKGYGQGCGSDNIGPLAFALKQIQKQYRLPADQLEAMIDAREFDLAGTPMADLASYRDYSRKTGAITLALASQILDRGKAQHQHAELFISAAAAIQLCGHLQTWPEDAERRKLFLPQEIFTRQGAELSDILAKAQGITIEKSIEDLCKLAHEWHSDAMARLGNLPDEKRAQLLPAFLLLAPTSLILKRRRKRPLAPITIPHWRSYWSIWRMAANT
nr:squalene/phytoene synthase family protein [uncultured Cohaesibacter sp.]